MYTRIYKCIYKFMPFCLQSKLFHLFAFITAKSHPMSGHVWRKHRSFSTAFTFNGSTAFFVGIFHILTLAETYKYLMLQSVSCFGLYWLAVACLVYGASFLPSRPLSSSSSPRHRWLLPLFLRGCQACMLRYIKGDFSAFKWVSLFKA